MTKQETTSRLVKLEMEAVLLKAARGSRSTENAQEWFERFSSSMANDPAFVEMIKLGKEWREAQCDDVVSKQE